MEKKIETIIAQLNKQGKMLFVEGTTNEQITQFEKNNDVELPSKYKEWLLLSDGANLFLPAGIQMYGVEHNPVIKANNNDRPSEEYIVIGSTSWGDPIICEKNGEKVAIYNHEAGIIEEDEIYDNFFDFLSDLSNLLGIGE